MAQELTFAAVFGRGDLSLLPHLANAAHSAHRLARARGSGELALGQVGEAADVREAGGRVTGLEQPSVHCGRDAAQWCICMDHDRWL